MSKREILLVYDHQCPVCNAYCRRVQINGSAGRLHLVDARDPSEVMDEVTARGLDIDQGMVLRTDEGLFYGSEAIHQLSLLGARSDLFNRLNSLVFRSSQVSRRLYPVLRFFRNLLLKILGRAKINNLNLEGNDKF